MQDDFNSASVEWFALSDGMHPLVPRAEGLDLVAVRGICRLPVLESAAFSAHEDIVSAALLMMSQSPVARDLADVAIRAGYRIQVNAAATESASASAFGNTDPVNRLINISACDAPETFALRLIHELVHVSQMERGGLSPDTQQQTPMAAIRQLLAMEADARARTIQVAIELEFAGENDPPERLLLPGMVLRAGADAGVDKTLQLVRDVLPDLPHDVSPDLLLAAAFRSFYSSAGLRRHYEASVIAAMETAAEKLFTGGKSASELTAALDSHMAPAYIAKFPDIIDLGSNFYSAISQKTQTQLEQLQETRPVTEARWRLPLYDAQPQTQIQTQPQSKAGPAP